MTSFLPSLTVIFCLGIFIGNMAHFGFVSFYAVSLFFASACIFYLRSKVVFQLFLFCLVFFLGASVIKNAHIIYKNNIKRLVYRGNSEPYLVKGIIASDPEITEDKSAFVFKAKELQSKSYKYNCSGNILVRVKTGIKLQYSDELILHGRIFFPYANSYGGRTSYRDYLFRRDIFTIMNVNKSADVVRLNTAKTFSPVAASLSLKHKMNEIISRHLSPLAAAITSAMVLGDKNSIPPLVSNLMMRSGTVHILVVSGFNVGIVIFITGLFLKIIRIPRHIRPWLIIPCIIIYCFMTGSSNPVIRASVMGIMFLLGFFIKRETDIYNIMSFAALSILFFRPNQLFDIGFQLSFVSVISIVFFYPKLSAFLKVNSYKVKAVKFLLEGLLVSFSAWFGTLWLIAYYFKIFSPITVLANIFIVPLATFITLSGICLVFSGLFFLPLAGLFASCLQTAVVLLFYLNNLFLKLPGAYWYLP